MRSLLRPGTALAATVLLLGGCSIVKLHQVGGIGCDGGPQGAESGTVVLTATSTTAAFDITLDNANSTHIYSIELFERDDPGCVPDDNADTGQRMTTDANGDAHFQFSVALPYSTWTGAVVGDGQGSEEFVLVLDATQSTTGAGDAFSANCLLLPGAPGANCTTEGE